MKNKITEINKAKMIREMQQLMEMQIYSSRYVLGHLEVIRVPGGWIYAVINPRNTNAVFVPEPKE